MILNNSNIKISPSQYSQCIFNGENKLFYFRIVIRIWIQFDMSQFFIDIELGLLWYFQKLIITYKLSVIQIIIFLLTNIKNERSVNSVFLKCIFLRCHSIEFRWWRMGTLNIYYSSKYKYLKTMERGLKINLSRVPYTLEPILYY